MSSGQLQSFRSRNTDPREQHEEQWHPSSHEYNYQEEPIYYSEAQRNREKLTPRSQRKQSRSALLWMGIAACLLILFLAFGTSAHHSVPADTQTYAAPSGQQLPPLKQPIDNSVQQSFHVGSAPTLTVHVQNIRVSIQAANDGIVNASAMDGGQVSMQQHGNTITISQEASDHTDGGVINIAVPEKTDISVVTVNAPVDVHMVTGKVNIATTSGSIQVLDSTLLDSSMLMSVNDSISFSGIFSPRGKYRMTTLSGDISVVTPPYAQPHVTASTVSGRIEDPLPSNTGSSADVQLHTLTGIIRVGQK